MTDANHVSTENICPHLGSSNDPELRYLFANPIHICLKSNSRGGISFEHQSAFCITKQHTECPLYGGQKTKSSPDFIRKPEAARTKTKRSNWIWLSALLFILTVSGIGLGLFFWGNESQTGRFSLIMADSATPHTTFTDPTQTLTPLPTQTVTASPTKTLTPTVQPSDTPVPTETEVVPPTPGPNLGTPFGNFVLHRVKTGESLAAIASLYQVSSERISAVNITPEGRGIWAGDIMVIPIGEEIDEGIRFEYIFIEKKTALTTLVETYSVALESLRAYNLLGPLDWVPAGRWLIIPVLGE